MRIEHNTSLRQYNTFGIEARAKVLITVSSIDELKEALNSQKAEKKPFILGGGSNILLTSDIEGVVIYLDLKGRRVIEQSGNKILVEAMAGENWHDFVVWCLDRGYGGLENLALIPGHCGTAPIQNIGAYGVELKDRFVSCKALEITSGKIQEFTKADCEFGYRQSVFKNRLKGNYVITAVTFELSTTDHQLNTSYGAIKEVLDQKKINTPTINDVATAVMEIRQSKLPDPKELGNAGSFFKNPVIGKEAFNAFQRAYPEAPFYKLEDGTYKVPAGWLIEKAGFKGKRFGDTGVHKKQALVLVNYGSATGKEVWSLAKKIRLEVKSKFGIVLEPEVNVI